MCPTNHLLPFSSFNKALYLSFRFCSLWSLFAIFPHTRETYSRVSNLYVSKTKTFEKTNQNSKDRSVVMMASLLVSNAEKFELEKDSSQRDYKIHSNYKNFRITEIRITERKLKSFLRRFHGDFKFVRIMEISALGRFELERANCTHKQALHDLVVNT